MAILTHPDFAEAKHSTKWVEDVLDLSRLTVAPGRQPPRPGARRRRRPDRASATSRPRWTAGASPSSSGCPTSGRWRLPTRRGRAPSGRRRRPPAATGSGDVAVPMQGTIVKVLVAVGDKVEVGQTICLLEAMKMENAVNAEKDGVIKEVRVSAGASVGAGDIVAVIE